MSPFYHSIALILEIHQLFVRFFVSFVDQLLASVLSYTLGALDFLLQIFFSGHWTFFSGTALVSVLSFSVGRRLKKYNHPDLPLASPAIRFLCGGVIYWIGFIAILFIALISSLIVLLLLFGSGIKSVLHTLDLGSAISYYFCMVWLWTQDQIYGFLGGALAGSFLSAYLVFKVIPAHERGEGLRVCGTWKNFLRR